MEAKLRGRRFLPLFFLLGLGLLAFPAVAYGGGLGLSGTLAGKTLTLAQGEELASGDIYVVVFNTGTEKLTVEMAAAAPAEVSVEFTEERFTLYPEQNKQVGIRVKVGRYARPGTYNVEVTARQLTEPTGGQVAVGVAVAQGATLEVLPGPPVSFADIKGHWAQKDIEVMAGLGIARGVDENKFDPEGQVTRAEFAAFLIRSLGIEEVKPATGNFKDVPATAWPYGAVEAAYASGLVSGYGDGTFRPDKNISREEIAAMVTRALAQAGPEVSVADADALLARFTDAKQISAWAKEAAAQAVSAGIVGGRGGNRFAARENASRAEAVVMLKRMLVSLGEIADQ